MNGEEDEAVKAVQEMKERILTQDQHVSDEVEDKVVTKERVLIPRTTRMTETQRNAWMEWRTIPKEKQLKSSQSKDGPGAVGRNARYKN